MATRSRLVITVTSTRGSSNIQVSSKGRYISMDTNGIDTYLTGQPIFGTLSETAYWTAVLAAVASSV